MRQGNGRVGYRWVLCAAALFVLGIGLASSRVADTGVEMTKAAQAFLTALTDEQRTTAQMSFDDPRRLDWHFIPKPERKGLQIKHMDTLQRERAHALLSSGVSEVGYEKARGIMMLESILRELEKTKKDGAIRDPERYYFTVFGEPSERGRWGWSVEGHHLSLNFVVQDGKVASITPAFYAANPAVVKSDMATDLKAGTRILAQEEELAFVLLGALNEEQRKAALIDEKAPMDLRGAAEPRSPATGPAGLPAARMNAEQKMMLWKLIEAYTQNMPPDEGAARLAEVERAGIEQVYFAWAGADRPGIGHYYRIQGPTFLVEFVNTQPDAAGNPANHIHSFWRQAKGDFGIEE